MQAWPFASPPQNFLVVDCYRAKATMLRVVGSETQEGATCWADLKEVPWLELNRLEWNRLEWRLRAVWTLSKACKGRFSQLSCSGDAHNASSAS